MTFHASDNVRRLGILLYCAPSRAFDILSGGAASFQLEAIRVWNTRCKIRSLDSESYEL
jgi:hypothetical protein